MHFMVVCLQFKRKTSIPSFVYVKFGYVKSIGSFSQKHLKSILTTFVGSTRIFESQNTPTKYYRLASKTNKTESTIYFFETTVLNVIRSSYLVNLRTSNYIHNKGIEHCFNAVEQHIDTQNQKRCNGLSYGELEAKLNQCKESEEN